MSGDSSPRSRALAWLARRSLRQVLLLAGAVVLVVSGAFGGLAAAGPEPVQRMTAGTARDVLPFTLTLERARWTTDLSPIGVTTRGRYLVVVATVRSEQPRSVDGQVLVEALLLRGVRGIYADAGRDDVSRSETAVPGVFVLADGSRLSGVAPSLTYEVAFVWEQRGSEPVPDRITVETRTHTFRASTLDGQEGWFDPTTDAVLDLPVSEAAAS